MKIDDAIANLLELKAKGKKHIIQSVWTADIFNVPDDRRWRDVCKAAEDASLYDMLCDRVDSLIEEIKIEDQKAEDDTRELEEHAAKYDTDNNED
jgi:hypothetical protein